MKLGRPELNKLQEALDRNRKWSPVKPEPKLGRQAAKFAKHAGGSKTRLPQRPVPFDEPGIAISEQLDAVGLGFDGLSPVFLVRHGELIDILEIQDELQINFREAKYKIRAASGRFIISRIGRRWTLEKQLSAELTEE